MTDPISHLRRDGVGGNLGGDGAIGRRRAHLHIVRKDEEHRLHREGVLTVRLHQREEHEGVEVAHQRLLLGAGGDGGDDGGDDGGRDGLRDGGGDGGADATVKSVASLSFETYLLVVVAAVLVDVAEVARA